MDSVAIEQLIRSALPGAEVTVQSDDNVHFQARVVDPGFAGRSRLARHRLVHQALGPSLGTQIHALSLDLKSPEEAEAG